MSYCISASEKKRGLASEYETKAMLHLLSCTDDSDKIYFFIVDIINDVSGHDEFFNECWDVQSKAYAKNTMKQIGSFLITLFKNYLSDFNIAHPILFLKTFPVEYLEDANKKTFDINNINSDAIGDLKSGLNKEMSEKDYTKDIFYSENEVDEFLEKVIFIIGEESKSFYIKNTIKLDEKFIPDEDALEDIFNEIQRHQDSLKCLGCVEGQIINNFVELKKFKRTIESREIVLFILNQILNHDIMHSSSPMLYTLMHSDLPLKDLKTLNEDCKERISKTLFDKNKSNLYWKCMNEIFTVVTTNPSLDVLESFDLVDCTKYKKLIYLNKETFYYLICMLKESLNVH